MFYFCTPCNRQETSCFLTFSGGIEMKQREMAEVVTHSCSVEKVFLKILRSSQENDCARVSFIIKLEATVYSR